MKNFTSNRIPLLILEALQILSGGSEESKGTRFEKKMKKPHTERWSQPTQKVSAF